MMNKQAFYVKDGFVKREIAGEILLVPVGERTREFNGMITLNETGSFLWDLMAKPMTEEELLSAVLSEFDIDEQTAREDIEGFLKNGIQQHLVLHS